MSATNIYSSATPTTHAKFKALVDAIAALLPTTIGTQTFSGFDFSFSPGFHINLEVSPDGQKLSITTKCSDQGQNNSFGPPDGGPAGHYSRVPALVIDGSQMP